MAQVQGYPPARLISTGDYGRPDMLILASNNPECQFDCTKHPSSTFRTRKRAFPVYHVEFARQYEAEIHEKIVEIVQTHLLSACLWRLHVLRWGFQFSATANPIVVHLLAVGDVANELALAIVNQISATIATSWQVGEPVYVDLCRPPPQDLLFFKAPKLRASEDPEGCPPETRAGQDLSGSWSQMYTSPPFPGMSVGKKDETAAGSFTGYIKHEENEIYGLTCAHVLDPSGKVLGVDRKGTYVYTPGETSHLVEMPAMNDDTATKKGCKESYDMWSSAKEEETKKLEKLKVLEALGVHEGSFAGTSRAAETALRAAEMSLEHWSEMVKQSESWTEIQPRKAIIAVSDPNTPSTAYAGRLDWAIFEIDVGLQTKNKHLPHSMFDSDSEFLELDSSHRNALEAHFDSGNIGPIGPQTNADERNPKDKAEAFRSAAWRYFRPGPEFKPLRRDDPKSDEVFFKVPSRTTGWKQGTFTGIKATLASSEFPNITREWCFVSPSPYDQVTRPGDSGAPLIDSNFRPIAMAWGGLGIGYHTIHDVTYATPIHVILSDIETCMGWAEGSVSFC
ncbi:uncharacterized protein LY89DRAFT_686663 [Mollisia scopiformis]|uniref:Uncharacterized protein n=1 Tax=Mollisia scopiformis TaxID=149040 RepID=A0A194X1Q7_MOLSC|nr:uncharacterized protein LY89DRAFT_686663 [Mollisia scopiformis]KUJ14128.1 hypothetical protein LY89DRAFT_686663 [Mollisia scopiformis]